ncbi:MAG: glycosyltransferase [Lentisphaerae bacterium]|nr:glycosyltransferase [Lentisphaerota bacterium]
MKIVWILNGCGLESGSITGSPLRFQAVSSRWQALTAGPEQHLMTTSGGEAMLRRMGCTLPATRLPAALLLRREPCKAFRFWSYVVTAAAARLRPGRLPTGDVVITVSDYFCDIVPALLLKERHGSRWIAWIHHRERRPAERPGNRLVNTITWRMQAWSFRQIARHANQAWVYDSDAGDEIARHLQGLGMAPERIRRMRCGIDLAAIRRAPEPPAKTVDAVMIGVRPNKGAFDIVPVWREVQRLRPGTTLRLMGGLSCREQVAAQIAAAGLGDVISWFVPEGGWLPPEAHFAKIKEARILFAPSREEGWGIALGEAMGCGLPVAAYDLPVYRRIFGDAPAVVPEGDTCALARTIVALLDHPEHYAEHRRRGQACAETDDWDRIAADDWPRAGSLENEQP